MSKWWILVLLVAFVACDSNGPTTPDTVPTVGTQETVTSQSVPQAQPTPEPSPTPKPELPLWVSCDPVTGICTFGTDKPRPVYAKCTLPAQHAPVYGEWNSIVSNGDTVDVRDICNKIEPEDCAPKTVAVQVDFQGMGRHLGHLGPLYHLTFPQRLSPEECEGCPEGEPTIWDEWGEWGECELTALTVQETCYECKYGVRYSQECDEEPIIIERLFDRREVDCPNGECVIPPEGTTLSWSGPGNPDTECAAFNSYGGPYEAGTPADFYLCKAGTDREVWYSFPDGDYCNNGKERSHSTECRCIVED